MIKIIMLITAVMTSEVGTTTITMERSYDSVEECLSEVDTSYIAAQSAGANVTSIDCVQSKRY